MHGFEVPGLVWKEVGSDFWEILGWGWASEIFFYFFLFGFGWVLGRTVTRGWGFDG